jgi:hypothetical protein
MTAPPLPCRPCCKHAEPRAPDPGQDGDAPRANRVKRLWPPTRVALKFLLNQAISWAVREWLGW